MWQEHCKTVYKYLYKYNQINMAWQQRYFSFKILFIFIFLFAYFAFSFYMNALIKIICVFLHFKYVLII